MFFSRTVVVIDRVADLFKFAGPYRIAQKKFSSSAGDHFPFALRLGGSSQLLYFAAGPDEEAHGLFGVLTPVSEPPAYAMMLVGLGVVTLLMRLRKLSRPKPLTDIQRQAGGIAVT